MKNTRRIVQTLLIINSIQLAAGLSIWGYTAKTAMDSGEYIVFAALGLMLLSSMITLGGLYLALKSKDNQFEESLRDLEELNTTLRAQRHDYLNHFQVIYGLMELEEYEEARNYLEPVFKDIMKAGRALKTSKPAVNALLQAKWNAAEEQGIEVFLEVRSDLRQLPMEAWNLCKILANIIDNAIHVLNEQKLMLESTRMQMTENARWQSEGQRVNDIQISQNYNMSEYGAKLWIQITEEKENYYFSISNNGSMIPENMREKIFRQGVTTKQGEGHGMGLFIVDKLVREAGGRVELQSSEERTTFHVVLPKIPT